MFKIYKNNLNKIEKKHKKNQLLKSVQLKTTALDNVDEIIKIFRNESIQSMAKI